MANLEFLGFIAGTLTTVSIIPQVIKTWKLKETKDISLGMYILMTLGIFLWLIYGLYLSNMPLILSNLITIILCLMVLYFKIRYK